MLLARRITTTISMHWLNSNSKVKESVFAIRTVLRLKMFSKLFPKSWHVGSVANDYKQFPIERTSSIGTDDYTNCQNYYNLFDDAPVWQIFILQITYR